MKNWRLFTHALGNEQQIDLRRLPSAKGIWAPCLTYCEEEQLFYLMTRGLSYKEAVKLIVKANFQKIIDRINDEELRNVILKEIDKKLD